jgi:phenylacetate-coenzyme A ligase PaaK-like adenylate-forming protein
MAGLLADEQLAGRLHIHLRGGAFGAEALTPNLRNRIRAAWGFEPVTVYAATESPVIASSTPQHPELEIHEDVVLVEVVDEHDRPVPAGTPGFKILITNLVNFAQPLIRYEITDAVTLAPGPNPAGRPYRCLASVSGRSAEILHLPTPAGCEVAVHRSALGAAFAHFPEVRQYQFFYDEGGLHARVVLAPDAPADAPAYLRRSLVHAIEANGTIAPAVDVERVTALQRDSGPGAKIKIFTSTHPASSAAPVG